jgi:CMP/dCMP kinase
MSEKRIIVAIDGPSGAGKSTLARRIAERLGFVHINTGAIYRAVALWALRLNVALDDMYRLEQLAKEAQIRLEGGRVLLNNEDVTEEIREPQVSQAASKVSIIPGVRQALLGMQRGMAEQSSVVMEGRDIGSVVFPEAQVKIFLDAEPAERARRRAIELQEEANVTVLAGEMRARDERDRRRAEAPLVQAPDAELIDTTGLSLEQVEEAVLRVVRARTSNGRAAGH